MKQDELSKQAYELYPVAKGSAVISAEVLSQYMSDTNKAARDAYLAALKASKLKALQMHVKVSEVLLETLRDLDAAKPMHPAREGSPYLFKEDYDRAYKKWARKRAKLAEAALIHEN